MYVCLHVKFNHRDMTQRISEPCYFYQFKKKKNKKQNTKTSKFPPGNGSRSKSTTWHRAWGCLGVSLARKYRLSATSEKATACSKPSAGTESQREEIMLNQFLFSFNLKPGGSVSEQKETWSSQQDVINVTSSVGTRGSSTVHSKCSQEKGGEKKTGFFFLF